jgi:tripartite-type tricarboxylate transporter receptor subunit TctC
MIDLVNGQIPLAFTSFAVARQYFDSGKLVPIAVTSRKRSSDLSSVPTVAETAIPDYEVTAWYGVVAPAHTSKEIVSLLNREIVAIMRQPDVLERMIALGLDVQTSTPDEMRNVIATEISTWARVVSQAKLKVE